MDECNPHLGRKAKHSLSRDKISILLLLVLTICTTGCAGFINGYMAFHYNNPEIIRIQSSWFPAVNSDLHLMKKSNESSMNLFQKTFSYAFLGLDLPISVCVDTLFMPLRAPILIKTQSH